MISLLVSDYAQLLIRCFIYTSDTARLINLDNYAEQWYVSERLGSFAHACCGGLVDFAWTWSSEGWLEQGCRCVELRGFSASSIGIGWLVT